MEDKSRYRRLPATLKKITDINPEKDIRVRILGRVIDKQDGTIIIDDGTSTATIVTDAQININDFAMVHARVLPLEEGYELRGEIVQDMSSLDMNLYRKVYGDN